MGSACSTREIALKKIEPAPKSGEGGGIRKLFYMMLLEDSIYLKCILVKILIKGLEERGHAKQGETWKINQLN